MVQEDRVLVGGKGAGDAYGAGESSARAGSWRRVEPGSSTTATWELRRGRNRCLRSLAAAALAASSSRFIQRWRLWAPHMKVTRSATLGMCR